MSQTDERAVVADDDEPPTIDPQELIARYGRDVFNDFDIDDPRFNEHFFEVLDTMVAHCPVVRSNVGEGYYMVTRQADVRQVGQDWKTFSSAKGYMPNRPADLPFLYPEESDPPIHTAWRRALNPFLSPNAVEPYAGQIRADANALIDRFIDRGECEFVSEFGAKLPGWAFFKNVLGVPIDDLDDLVAGVENGTFAPPEERAGHMGGVFEYLGKYLAWRKDQPPRGDMVDRILEGVEYPDGTAAPWEHQVSILVDLTFGGIATTTYVMSGGLHHLATRPEDRRRLADDPSLIPLAVEEFVRVFPPVVALGRTCTRDVELHGTQIKEGDFVLLGYGAASRDPRVVENAAEIDIARETVLHSAFGVGPHRCIGSNLARLELKCTLEEWLKRIPDFSVKPGTAPVYETGILRTMKDLHFVF